MRFSEHAAYQLTLTAAQIPSALGDRAVLFLSGLSLLQQQQKTERLSLSCRQITDQFGIHRTRVPELLNTCCEAGWLTVYHPAGRWRPAVLAPRIPDGLAGNLCDNLALVMAEQIEQLAEVLGIEHPLDWAVEHGNRFLESVYILDKSPATTTKIIQQICCHLVSRRKMRPENFDRDATCVTRFSSKIEQTTDHVAKSDSIIHFPPPSPVQPVNSNEQLTCEAHDTVVRKSVGNSKIEAILDSVWSIAQH